MSGSIISVATYQVDLMVLVEEHEALLGGKLLLLVGLHALILKTDTDINTCTYKIP